MSEGRRERTRKLYACPICDGEGRIDDYEGSYPCSECDGEGILLRPYQPPRSRSPLSPVAEWIGREMLRTLENSLTFTKQIIREYK